MTNVRTPDDRGQRAVPQDTRGRRLGMLFSERRKRAQAS